MSDDLCPHRAKYGEGVEYPIADSLDHFDNCLPAATRLRYFERLQQWSAEARHCLMADHAGLLDEVRWMRDRVLHLTRELNGRPRRKAARIAYRARARRRTRSHR